MGAALRQQINLFQPIFRRQKQIFSTATMLQSVGVIVVALFTVYGYAVLQLGKLQAQGVELEGIERARSVQLASLDTAGAPRRRAEMERELDALNATLANQQQLIDVLQEQPPGSTSGFSRYLEGLARRRYAGVWLTSITLNGAQQAIELLGRSLDAARVPDYLSVLTSDTALSGQRFDDFAIERTDDGDVTFRVSSRAALQHGDEEKAR